MSLSFHRLRQLLHYNPNTGVFTWRVGVRGPLRKGLRAGTINGNGYRQICIDQVIYLCSRLAVFWMTGRWPKHTVDHKNRNKTDDRWRNLRPATYSQNGANSKARSELKGVTWDKNKNDYAARIKINYRTINLGHFDTAEEAHTVYRKAARKHFGKFARFA